LHFIHQPTLWCQKLGLVDKTHANFTPELGHEFCDVPETRGTSNIEILWLTEINSPAAPVTAAQVNNSPVVDGMACNLERLFVCTPLTVAHSNLSSRFVLERGRFQNSSFDFLHSLVHPDAKLIHAGIFTQFQAVELKLKYQSMQGKFKECSLQLPRFSFYAQRVWWQHF
jgi:hypothetical protein